MRRVLTVFCLILIPAISLRSGLAGDEATTHTATVKTEHFDIHVRPGSRAAASTERWASLAERFHARISKQLAFDPPERMNLYLYDSVEEMAAITKVTGAGGFSVTRTTHTPFDNEQTAYHELVHLFAEQLPKTGKEKRDFFHVEGLANALLEFVNGVHVHAVARYYKDGKRLPSLKEISTGKGLFGWMPKHKGMRGYDIAGSFMRHLLDTYGAANVKRYYTGTSAKDAFGVDEAALEKGWHKTLTAYRLTAEVQTLLRKEHGERASFTHFEKDPEKRLPADVRGVPGDWRDLTNARMHPVDKKLWKREGELIVGSQKQSPGWVVCELGSKKYADCIAMVRITIPEFCPAVQLRLGDGCQALYVSNGTFLYRGGQGLKANNKRGNPGRGDVHLVLVRRGHHATIYVNGEKALEVANADATPSRVGIGFLNGTVHFREVKVRQLKK